MKMDGSNDKCQHNLDYSEMDDQSADGKDQDQTLDMDENAMNVGQNIAGQLDPDMEPSKAFQDHPLVVVNLKYKAQLHLLWFGKSSEHPSTAPPQ